MKAQTHTHKQSDWPRIKDDAVNLALQELPVRKEKESLSLSGLQLAFGFVRVPDNVLSNLRQLLWVTQARPLLCHELCLLSSEANPQKSSLNQTKQTFTVPCCYYCIYLSPSEAQHAGIQVKQSFSGFLVIPSYILFCCNLFHQMINAMMFYIADEIALQFLSMDRTYKKQVIVYIKHHTLTTT